MAFTNEQLERYSRHIILKEVGAKGQKKLLNAKVLVIGAGGLGAPVAMYLAAAGVGTIGIADADVVDLSNLQRQIIHATQDVGKPKVQSAKETMEAMNPDVKVITYHTFVTSENILDLIGRNGQFCDKVFDQRRLRYGEEAVLPCGHYPLPGPAYDVCSRPRPLLPLRIQGAASKRCRTDLQASGRHRRDGRRDRKPAGDGSRQVHSWRGQLADRLSAHLQCADDGIPQGETPEPYRGLRRLRNAPDHHQAH